MIRKTKEEIQSEYKILVDKVIAEVNARIESKCDAINRMCNAINEVQPLFAKLLEQPIKFKKDGSLHQKYKQAFNDLITLSGPLTTRVEWGTRYIRLNVSTTYKEIDGNKDLSSTVINKSIYLGERDQEGITLIEPMANCVGITAQQYKAALAEIKEQEAIESKAREDIGNLKNLIQE